MTDSNDDHYLACPVCGQRSECTPYGSVRCPDVACPCHRWINRDTYQALARRVEGLQGLVDGLRVQEGSEYANRMIASAEAERLQARVNELELALQPKTVCPTCNGRGTVEQ